MGKGKKKKPDLRGYATTSTPAKPVVTTEPKVEETSDTAPKIVENKKQQKQGKNKDLGKEDFNAAKDIRPLPLPAGPFPNAPIVALSFEDEERLIKLAQTWNIDFHKPVSEPASRFDLETAYESLSEMGFKREHIEQSMLLFKADISSALDWLSLNVPSEQLPRGWCTGQSPKPTVEPLKAEVEKPSMNGVTITAKAPLKSNSRGIVMLDDILKADEIKRSEEKLKMENANEVEKTIKAIANARARGDTEEVKRLGKVMAELKGSKSASRDREETPQITTSSSKANDILLAALGDDDLAFIKPKKANVESTIATENDDATGDTEKSYQLEPCNENPEPLQEDDSEGIFADIFDAEEDSSAPSRVTYAPLRFEGTIPPSWKGATPKSLLSNLLKRRGWDEATYSKHPKTGMMQVSISDTTQVYTYDAGAKCLRDSLEQELAATRALYCTFAEYFSGLDIQLPPDFRDIWREWLKADALAEQERAEARAQPRREFVSKLLEQQSLEAIGTLSSTSVADPTLPIASEEYIKTKTSSKRRGDLPTLQSVLRSTNRMINSNLPIFAIKDEFISMHFANEFVVVVGETGSGKTTQIPQFVLDSWVFSDQLPRIAVSEPRRVSATSVSQRIAEELGVQSHKDDKVNGLVAYQIRGESTETANTCLLFCTTGILLRIAIDDPLFLKFDVIIIDEVHERTLDSDVLMVLLKAAVDERKRRGLSPLKGVLMSATMNAERLSSYFGHCPILRAEGRTFPVEQYYLEDAIEMTGYDHAADCDPELDARDDDDDAGYSPRAGDELDERYSDRTCRSMNLIDQTKVNYDLIEKTIKLIESMDESKGNKNKGAILVFLPGLRYIVDLESRLGGSGQFSSDKYVIIPLHSSLSNTSQIKLLFDKPPAGKRKIVLSTNIAETGVTIPDVVAVIDTCRVNEVGFNEKRGLVVLREKFCSKSSAAQRSGRAGRVQEGICFRLVSSTLFHTKLETYTSPEIMRVPLDQICLTVLVQHWDPREFFPKALDPPSQDSVVKAIERLEKLKAAKVTTTKTLKVYSITSLGRMLARLPLDARLGKLVVMGTIFKCAETACIIASCASADKSVFIDANKKRAAIKLAVLDSDILTDAKAFMEWEKSPSRAKFARENMLDLQRLKDIQLTRNQLLSSVRDDLKLPISDENAQNYRILCTIVAAGASLSSVSLESPRTDYLETRVKYQCADGTEASLMKTSIGYGQGRGPLRLGSDGPTRTRYFAYSERMKTTRVYLRDITPVHPAAVLLLATSLKTLHPVRRVDIDGWTHVRCAPRTAALFNLIRHCFERELEVLFESNGKNIDSSRPLIDAALELLCKAD